MGIHSEQHTAFHRAVLALRQVIESGDFNKAEWMQDEATVRSLWLAASSVNYKLAGYVKKHERYPWDKVPIATDLRPAVFCTMFTGQTDDFRHASIHLENASCVDPIDAMAQLQSQAWNSVTRTVGAAELRQSIDRQPTPGTYHKQMSEHTFIDVGTRHNPDWIDQLCGCGFAMYFRECHACSQFDTTGMLALEQHVNPARSDINTWHEFAPCFEEDDGHRHDSGDILLTHIPLLHQCKYCGRKKAAGEAWAYGVQA